MSVKSAFERASGSEDGKLRMHRRVLRAAAGILHKARPHSAYAWFRTGIRSPACALLLLRPAARAQAASRAIRLPGADATLTIHFHQSGPFYFLCSVAAAAFLFIVHRARVRLVRAALVARQQELEQLVAQRTAQLEEEKEQLLAARETLRTQARRDGLTGLLNRTAILEQMEEELERSARSGRPFTVAMLDIDHFKAVNDTYGHLVGDAVLRQVAARLRRHLRNYDGMGRYGGEEFLILIPDFDAQVDPNRLELLRRAVASESIEEGPVKLHVTCSFGVATLRGGEQAIAETLLAAADQALYQAKNAGRNRVVYTEVHPTPDTLRPKGRREPAVSFAQETPVGAGTSMRGRPSRAPD